MVAIVKAFLAKYEIALWAGLALGGLVLLLWYNHHERQIGAAKVVAAVKLEADKRAAEVARIEADAKTQIDGLQAALVIASAPRPNPYHVRMCNPSVQVAPVSSSGGTVANSDGAGRPSDRVESPDRQSEGAGEASEGVDIGPDTEALLARVGAKLAYLQGYVRACQKAGNCKTEK